MEANFAISSDWGRCPLSQSRLVSESAGCNNGHDWSRLLACSRCSARIRHGVARAATSKGPSAALRHCCVFELASWLFSFFLFGFVAVLWLRPSTGDTLRLLLRRAAGRLRTEISHADRDFSLCSRCSARIRRGVAPVASSKRQGGGIASLAL